MRCLTAATALLLASSLLPPSVEAAIISVTDRLGNSNITITEGTPTVDVYIRIAPTDPNNLGTDDPDGNGMFDISGGRVQLQVGDGGMVSQMGTVLNAGTDSVTVTNVRIFDTQAPGDPIINNSVWDSIQSDPNLLVDPFVSGGAVNVNIAKFGFADTTPLSAPVGASGNVLAVVTLATAGLTAGQSDALMTPGGFRLLPDTEFDTIMAPAPAIDRHVGSSLNGVPLTLTSVAGLLTITSAPPAIPEPGSMLLLAMGTAVVGGRRLRRRFRSQDNESAADETE